jgi:hypothetical protein
MCVHPTKSGAQCKKNPELFLCGTHMLAPVFTLEQGKVQANGVVGDIIRIGGHRALMMAGGEIVAVDEKATFESYVAEAPARKPHGHVYCGACHTYHPNVNAVKVCYMQKRRAE